jgi:hypothetical protein
MNFKALKPQLIKQDMSTAGILAVIIALLFIFSLEAESRLMLGGLLVHPYLLAMIVFIPILRTNLFKIPFKGKVEGLLFILIFILAMLRNTTDMKEVFKILSTLATFLFFVNAVKSEKDFTAIAWALLITAGYIGYKTFGSVESNESYLEGFNALAGIGNKNAQSLYTLPGFFFGVYLMLKYIKEKKTFPLVLCAIMLLAIIGNIIISANRSGWVSAIAVILYFLYRAGLKFTTIINALLISVFIFYFVNYFAKDSVSRKLTQTESGYSSDYIRGNLFLNGVIAGIENPVLGLGQTGIFKSNGDSVGSIDPTDSHNLVAYLLGGTGLFCFYYFFLFLFKLQTVNLKTYYSKDARNLLRFFLFLFVFRSLFSREILYSPTFVAGLGVMVSYFQYKNKMVNYTILSKQDAG